MERSVLVESNPDVDGTCWYDPHRSKKGIDEKVEVVEWTKDISRKTLELSNVNTGDRSVLGMVLTEFTAELVNIPNKRPASNALLTGGSDKVLLRGSSCMKFDNINSDIS